jgi:hypothetical protein
MSYRPDESTLISYLYGELDAKESEKVKAYLQAHPEEQKQIQSMMSALDVMGKVKDKEVIAPPIFMDDAPSVKSIWFNGYLKTIMSIAASFLLLMVVGRLLGTEINYSQGELRISFGGRGTEQPVQQLQALSQEQVQQMINASLVKNNESVAISLDDVQKKLNASLQQNLAINSKKIDDLMKNAAAASQDQLRSFVASLQDDNVKSMQQYLQLSSAEQNKYVEGLLVDFSKYLQEQRNQDVMLFQTRMSSIEKNTDQFKQETEQILASIINTADGKKQSSY